MALEQEEQPSASVGQREAQSFSRAWFATAWYWMRVSGGAIANWKDPRLIVTLGERVTDGRWTRVIVFGACALSKLCTTVWSAKSHTAARQAVNNWPANYGKHFGNRHTPCNSLRARTRPPGADRVSESRRRQCTKLMLMTKPRSTNTKASSAEDCRRGRERAGETVDRFTRNAHGEPAEPFFTVSDDVTRRCAKCRSSRLDEQEASALALSLTLFFPSMERWKSARPRLCKSGRECRQRSPPNWNDGPSRMS